MKVLAGIMYEKKAPYASRVAAAQYLGDRGWGKAKETREVGVVHFRAEDYMPQIMDALAEVKRIEDTTPSVEGADNQAEPAKSLLFHDSETS